jgi:hypothetical protein
MKNDTIFMGEVQNLIESISALYGHTTQNLNFLDRDEISLEDVMTLIDINDKLFAPFANPQNRLIESRELRAVKELLVRTIDYALVGPCCNKHRKLVDKMSKGDIILSFNYDTLIDIALFNAGKMSEYGYRMNFSKVFSEGEWLPPTDGGSKVTLLKLHGSLNWVRCGFCGTLLLYNYDNQTLIGAEEFQCPRCSSGENFAKRVIVPPAQSKGYEDRDIAFLWIQADNLLKEISRVVCIGYSFPSSDFDMISLMRRLRAKQSSIPEVVFVSPDAQARKRAERIFGKESIQFNNLSKYLES